MAAGMDKECRTGTAGFRFLPGGAGRGEPTAGLERLPGSNIIIRYWRQDELPDDVLKAVANRIAPFLIGSSALRKALFHSDDGPTNTASCYPELTFAAPAPRSSRGRRAEMQ